MIDEWEAIKQFKQNMNLVFETALNKALHKRRSEGNTTEPYIDFDEEHLENRLSEEYDEYLEEGQARELIDVINIAAFLFLKKTIYKDEE